MANPVPRLGGGLGAARDVTNETHLFVVEDLVKSQLLFKPLNLVLIPGVSDHAATLDLCDLD